MRQALFLLADEISKSAMRHKYKNIPDQIKAGMLLHEQTPFYNKNVGLTHLVVMAILQRMLHERGVKYKSSEVVDLPAVRNALLVKHTFKTAEGKLFFAGGMSTFTPDPIDALANNILQFFVEKGCQTCGYGTKKPEEDLVCPVCLDGEIRKKMRAAYGSTFAEDSWHVLSEAIGPDCSKMLLDLASFTHNYQTSSHFMKAVTSMLFKDEDHDVGPESEGLLEEEFGAFISADLEKLLGIPFPLGNAKQILDQMNPESYDDDFEGDEE